MQDKIFESIDLSERREDLYTLTEKYSQLSQQVEDYQVSFSQTKTNHLLLTSQFQQSYEGIGPHISSDQQNNNLMKLYQSAQVFIERLEQSKLYKDVDLFLLPGDKQNQVHLHFSIKDRSPFFLSLQNSFGQDGAATMQLKTGMKNFAGLEDTLSFDFERQLSGRAILNWALAWGLKRQTGARIQLSISQSERGLHTSLWELKRAFAFKYITNKTEWSIEKSIKANRIQTQNITARDSVRNQQHLTHLDFIPDTAINFTIDHSILNTQTESMRENILEGQTLRIRTDIGLPYISNVFLKLSLTHQYQQPLYKYKNLLYNLKNASFQSNLNFGLAASKNLKFQDTFNLQQYRGFPEIMNQTELLETIVPSNRQMSCFYKADFKINFHNVGALKTQSAKMFYYLSGFGMIEKDSRSTLSVKKFKDNTRIVGGIGLAMPVSESAHIELLLNMFGLNRKRFDKFSTIQIRVAVED